MPGLFKGPRQLIQQAGGGGAATRQCVPGCGLLPDHPHHQAVRNHR
jgi:hypothetical protein